ncbi:unnamed protein product [Caenorhabditis angaria]|uniref:Succinate dehydrogenase assembly factor 2, mitochondrial n=1 Tax=Caenorhabditis angaria TaxID=860376 RepID=A0A9P1IBC5_9PELO|nr:unnamed protein product [Caenorhabditis angaria]
MLSRRFLSLSKACRSLARVDKVNESLDAKRGRLLYQSKKRGILENDILLGDFAQENLSKMTPEQLVNYDKLINGEHMEWDLFYYLSDKKVAPEEVASCPVYQLLKKFVDSKRVPRNI